MFPALILPLYAYWFGNGHIDLAPSTMDWLWLVVLGVVCTVYSYAESVVLMKRLSAFAVNLTVNLEPVYGIILALMIFGEREAMNTSFYLGGILILFSVFSYPWLDRLYKQRTFKFNA